jgi:hypothetical protein
MATGFTVSYPDSGQAQVNKSVIEAQMRDAATRCAPQPARAYWLLLALFVELQLADIVTTNHALTIPESGRPTR